ncbi:MAG: hypothetical protein ABI639_03940 [Thermoanaerobaculia bacterium]
MRLPRRTFLAFIAATALTLAGCFEPPVAERMLLEFLPDGGARATLMVDLGRPEDFESVAARRRIALRERELLEGSDPWFARFADLTTGDDGLSWQRTQGKVRAFRRWAELSDPSGFDAVFADDPVSYAYSRNGETATLEVTPSGASRATRRERQRVALEVAEWSGAFAHYLAKVFALESYLADHVDERESCWKRVFEVRLGKGEQAGGKGLPSAELPPAAAALAEAVNRGLADLLLAFEIDSSDAFSLDERVRKVFHPLSAQLLVSLLVPAGEVEGFEAAEPGDDEFGYAFPECSLLAALDPLEMQWLTAGPLRAMLDHLRGTPDAPMDIARFVDASIVRDSGVASAPPPSPTDISDQLMKLLRPAATYRLTWRVPEPAPVREGKGE